MDNYPPNQIDPFLEPARNLKCFPILATQLVTIIVKQMQLALLSHQVESVCPFKTPKTLKEEDASC